MAEQTYRNNDLEYIKVNFGKRNDYLGIILDYTLKGKLQVYMKYYIDKIIEEYPYPIILVSFT